MKKVLFVLLSLLLSTGATASGSRGTCRFSFMVTNDVDDNGRVKVSGKSEKLLGGDADCKASAYSFLSIATVSISESRLNKSTLYIRPGDSGEIKKGHLLSVKT